MSDPALLAQIGQAVAAGDEVACAELARQGVEEGVPPLTLVEEGFTTAIRIVGEGFGRGELFLPELMLSMMAMKAGLAVVEPELRRMKLEQRSLGTVLIGTVKGDIHDIGKSIVSTMLELNGFKVVDAGIDVPAAQFIERVGRESPHVLGLSAMLSTTMEEQRTVVEGLKEAGRREGLKVVVGGAPVSSEWAAAIGADGYGANAELSVQLVRRLLGKS
jgi:trimethylamine corrinoid protein